MTFDGRRILVVEDDFLVSLTTTDLLESMGCVVVGPAAQLAIAIRLAGSERVDAAILDIDIGGQAVWPVADELYRRNVPFLFLSAYSPPNGAPAHVAAAPRLDKPPEKSRLLRALASILAG